MDPIEEGKAMDDFLYGSVQLRTMGHQVDMFELAETSEHPASDSE
jgi:hypothetical protein